MNALRLAPCYLLVLVSCSTESGEPRCATLVSSTKERVYVKTYIWGGTGDGQLSTVAGNDTPISWADIGNPQIVEGSDPFIYRFAQDTLTFYSRAPLPTFSLPGSSITVCYKLINNSRYMALQRLTGHAPYHRVPD